jgi:RNA polymerase sigma-70 factor (ECF subfamily)
VSDEEDLMRALHDQHAAALTGYVRSLTGGDQAWTEDVVQETLIRAWRHPKVLDQSAGSARPWLFTVARRIVVDDWRSRQSRRETASAEPPDVPVEDGTDATVQAWMIGEALRRLSEAHREVLVECFYRGRSVASAAAQLGIPPGTVKSRTHYALRALKLGLDEMGVSS